MATESVKIVDTNGAAEPPPDYTSLNSWNVGEARDLTVSDEIAIAKCRCTAGAADTTAVSFSASWVGDATRYVKIWTDPTESYRHNGTYQTGNKYRLEGSGSRILGASNTWLKIIGLQIKVTTTSTWKYGIYLTYQTTSPNKAWYEQNIIVGVLSGAADNNNGIRIISYNTTHYVSNNVIYGFLNATAGQGILTAAPALMYNNTIVGCSKGITRTGTWTTLAKNCLTQDCADGFYGTFSDGSTNNCSDIVDDAPGTDPHTGDVTFAGAGDYHLSATDTVAKDHGADLSSDASYPISVDIDGVLRVASWDIGADETVADSVSWGSATATGRGLAELIATVIVAGSCTATGRGTVEIDAIVLVAASADATGRGTAELEAVVIAAGAATATGRGSVVLVAVVTHSASGAATGHGTASCYASVQAPGASATATGRGTATLTAVVTHSASAICTGRGGASCVASVQGVGASATATGLGTAQLVAVVIAVCGAALTGRGTVYCDAWVLQPGAHATLTGRGFAWCSLSEVYFAPLARHFGTRAVRVGSAGSRRVSSAHSATRSCESEDERLCGARRLN